MKRIISVFLALTLFVAAVFTVPYVTFASSITSNEAVRWAASQVGASIDYDGASGVQCVDFIMAYYDYLGGTISGGNAVDYVKNDLPNGWIRTKGGIPQRGDILIYAGGTDKYYGHLGIYDSFELSYHQGGGIVYKSNAPYYEITSSRGGPYWGCIHPDFKDDDTANSLENLCLNGHTVVEDSDRPANCTMSGKTAGCHCSVCGKVIIAQQIIEPKGHDFGNNFKYCSRCLIENPNYEEPNAESLNENKDAINSVLIPSQAENTTFCYKTEVKLKTPSVSKIKKYKKAAKIYWKRIPDATGYQIQYSTDKKFRHKKTVSVNGSKNTALTVKGLKSKARYYFRVRAYRTTYNNSVKTKNISSWSKTKSITVK